MIKYVELTAPEASAYRQAKIISIERNEGDTVSAGDTLFIVQSGNTKLELPSTKEGRIVEFIVSEQENISLSTPLLLLETTVEKSTATTPINVNAEQEEAAIEPIEPEQVAQDLEPVEIEETLAPPPPAPVKKKAKKKTKKVSKKATQSQNAKVHKQQSLDLMAGLDDTTNSTEAPISAPQPEPVKAQAHHVETTESNSMSDNTLLTINVPDIGADSAKVIEILVNVGDQINAEDALVTLESDKASMDVPSPQSGTIKSIAVSVDQDVSEGTALIELEISGDNGNDAKAAEPATPEASPEANVETSTAAPAASSSAIVDVAIPDIGGDAAKVVEILVSVGDTVDVEDALVTLESDKASMEVPSSNAGVIKSIEVNVDDEVSEGTVVVTLESSAAAPAKAASAPAPAQPEQKAAPSPAPAQAAKPQPSAAPKASGGNSHASPSIRRFARELGVDLTQVSGSGRKSRITKDDVKSFVKGVITQGGGAQQATSSGAGIPAIPAQDFSKFGEIEVQPLNKIKRLTATNLHRSWLNVPHVTHNDETNINDLESFRKQLNAEYKAQNKNIKLSPLAFIVKAVVNALQTYPQFNSSLESGGENLVLKKYFHVGIAVDTPNGLVVPVIRDADKKSVAEIATEMGELAKKARDKKLTMNDMSGACFTISSLGGIGGTSFTPIVNAPEVAILGVARSKIQPVWNGSEFTPGMMLPLSLSYDHRVIDGAEAARFTRHIAMILEDVRRLTV